MNLLATQVSSRAQNYLNVKSQEGILVPIGTFSGIPFLVGCGVQVKLDIKLVGAAELNFNYLINAACTNNMEQSPKWQLSVCLSIYTRS